MVRQVVEITKMVSYWHNSPPMYEVITEEDNYTYYTMVSACDELEAYKKYTERSINYEERFKNQSKEQDDV